MQKISLAIAITACIVGLCHSEADDKKLNQIDAVPTTPTKIKKEVEEFESIPSNLDNLAISEAFPYGYGYGLGGYGLGGLYDQPIPDFRSHPVPDFRSQHQPEFDFPEVRLSPSPHFPPIQYNPPPVQFNPPVQYNPTVQTGFRSFNTPIFTVPSPPPPSQAPGVYVPVYKTGYLPAPSTPIIPTKPTPAPERGYLPIKRKRHNRY